jgi:hypothetical protein
MNSFSNLAMDEDDRAAGFKLMARKIYDRYQAKTTQSKDRVGLAPFESIEKEALNRILDTEAGVPPQARAIIRTKLGMPAEPPKAAAPATPDPEPSPGSSTNSPPATAKPATA